LEGDRTLAGAVGGAFGRGPARLAGLRGVGLAYPSGAFIRVGLREVVVSAPAEHPSSERPAHGPYRRRAVEEGAGVWRRAADGAFTDVMRGFSLDLKRPDLCRPRCERSERPYLSVSQRKAGRWRPLPPVREEGERGVWRTIGMGRAVAPPSPPGGEKGDGGL